MNQHCRIFIPIVLLGSMLLPACTTGGAASTAPEARDTLYQVSTINSLMAGNYDGLEMASQIMSQGDFGIGTFDSLDGEMVMINGSIYRVKSNGVVEKVSADTRLPFTAVTYFDTDSSQDVSNIQNLDALKATLDKQIVKKDRFYAVRVDGVFSTVQVRSVPKQQKPYPILSEVTKNQAVFDYENVKGSLVGFWCPDYVGSINVPGYHLHFISDDLAKGGHLLDISFSNAKIMLDETRFFEMALGENAQQDAGITDAQKEIDKVEK